MKYLWILLVVAALTPALGAKELGLGDFSAARHQPRTLFHTNEVSFEHGEKLDQFVRAPILGDTRNSEDQMFGAGASLGINSAAIAISFGAFFDFYFTPWLAAGTFVSVSYGFLGQKEHNGGDALAFSASLGAKFVLDFADMDITDWWRPYVAFYPLGVTFFSATEDADIPGTGNTKDVKYSDVFFLMLGGVGSDFFLTNTVGIGIGLYVWGTIGGSKHKHRQGIETTTSGAIGVYFEYARLTLRF